MSNPEQAHELPHWREKQLRFLRGYYGLILKDLEGKDSQWVKIYRDRLKEVEAELGIYED